MNLNMVSFEVLISILLQYVARSMKLFFNAFYYFLQKRFMIKYQINLPHVLVAAIYKVLFAAANLLYL